MLNVLIVFVE